MAGRKQTSRHSRWVALFAAYTLLLQALFSAYAIGASADPLAAGAICSTAAIAGTPIGKDSPIEHRLPDCCLAGCPMFGAALLPQLPAAPFFHAEAFHRAGSIPRDIESDWRPRPGTPLHPRAPPLAI